MRSELKSAKRIVVKVGTTSLAHPNGKLNLKAMQNLALVLSDIASSGKEVILVSSGAIAAGSAKLGLSERPRDIIGKQSASAVGQSVLMQLYEHFFSGFNQTIAQLLLTKDVFTNDAMKINAKNTIERLLSLGVLPIVNENDTISTDELHGFSDNDSLSSYVARLANADALIILSDINALYDKDPSIHKDARAIPCVLDPNESTLALAGDAATTLGTGGMRTKVQAAINLASIGIAMVIASGKDASILYEILEGKEIGTIFKRSKNDI